MRIRSFRGLVPTSNAAARDIISPPYDCVSECEARAILSRRPGSFIGVVRPDALDGHGGDAYAAAAARLRALTASGALAPPPARAVYVYELAAPGTHAPQRGLVALVSVADYDARLIRRHENTRPEKVLDRTRLADALAAQTGPVFLTYRDVPAIDALADCTAREEAPLFDVVADDQVRHRVWRVPDDHAAALVHHFEKDVPVCYIADGHHRAESSALVARKSAELRKEDPNNPDSDAAWFLGVLFPETQLTLLPYNRFVHDLNGLSLGEFRQGLSEGGILSMLDTTPEGPPPTKGTVFVYVDSTWYSLDFTAVGATNETQSEASVADGLDCSLLQQRVLGPLLRVENPRTCTRIEFIGGSRGPAELQKLVDDRGDGVAFLLHPVSVSDLMEVADAGGLMPPKSTWFVPKLASGFFIQTYN